MSNPVRPSTRVCIRTDEGSQHCGVPIPEAEMPEETPAEPPTPPAVGTSPEPTASEGAPKG
jgi:hypothetical protein